MSLRDQPALRVILYEGPGARRLEAETRFEALAALLERGYAVTRTAGAGAVAPADASPALLLADFDENGELTALELSEYLHDRFRHDVKSKGLDDYVLTGGPQSGYQHLVVDRGGVGPYNVLFNH